MYLYIFFLCANCIFESYAIYKLKWTAKREKEKAPNRNKEKYICKATNRYKANNTQRNEREK